MSRAIPASLAVSLMLTIAFEIGFFLLTGKRDKKDLLLLVLLNALTNPLVVLLYWIASIHTNWNTSVIKMPLELFAILTEGYYYQKYGCVFRRPYIFSIAANMFSFWLGVLLQYLF